MAAQLTRDPEPLYQCCPDVPQPLSAIIMQCLAKKPEQRPPTAEALMSALDSITTSSGEIKTAAIKTLPAVSLRRRRMTIGAGLATVVLGSAVAVFASQRNQPRPVATVVDSSAAKALAAGKSAAPPPAPAAIPAAPIALTRKDSLAIAEAVQKRLAKEEAVRGKEEVAIIADSITSHVRRAAIDSILRANLPAGVAIPMWRDMAPPPEWGGKRRVVVTEPRAGRNENLNAFGAALSDSIRRALMKRKGMSVVDPDSVSAVLAVTRSRADVESSLKPDLLITPTVVGAGDSMSVIVTIRDVKSGNAYGTRVASSRINVNDPEVSIPGLVQSIIGQVESLSRMPVTFRFVKPNQPRVNRENQ
jgi:hypothetical protein